MEGRGGPAVPRSTRTQLGGRKSKARRGRNRRRHERGIQQLGGMLSSRMPGQAPREGAQSTLLLESQASLQHLGLSPAWRGSSRATEGDSAGMTLKTHSHPTTACLSPWSVQPDLRCKTSPARQENMSHKGPMLAAESPSLERECH